MRDIESNRIAAGLRTFRNIARVWKLSEAEMAKVLGQSLSNVSAFEQQIDRLKTDKTVARRLSALLGIHAALESVLPGRAAQWLRAPNNTAPFSGRTALDVMLAGSLADLICVRQYLDSQLA